MDAGTRDLLGKAEGKVWGHVDEDDDVFEFGSRAVSEQALVEMRMRNALAAQRAMADLRGGRVNLPAVSTAASRRPLGAVPRTCPRPSPAGVLSAAAAAGSSKGEQRSQQPRHRDARQPRAQTPNEVRSAAEQEVLAEERREAQRPRDSRSRPGSSRELGSTAGGGSTGAAVP